MRIYLAKILENACLNRINAHLMANFSLCKMQTLVCVINAHLEFAKNAHFGFRVVCVTVVLRPN